MNKLFRTVVAATAWCVGSGLAGEARAEQAQAFRYRYVTFDSALPAGFSFFEPRAITDDGRVFGTLAKCDENGCSFFVGVYRQGRIAALRKGFANTANDRGTVGGEVLRDPRSGERQAALFDGGRVRLVPSLPGERRSSVRLLTDSGIAFVASVAGSSPATHYLRRSGRNTLLPFGPSVGPDFGINDRAVIAGTSFARNGRRAFRYDTGSGRTTPLRPLGADAGSAARAINGRGEVLGYSYPSPSCGVERVGVWRGTTFQTYFVEGTPALPTHSSGLLWNERGLVVITRASPCTSHDRSDMNSYLVPKPGVRLKLADLVDGRLPPWTSIEDVNSRGDLVGIGSDQFFGIDDAFLLERVDSPPDRASARARAANDQAVAPAARRAPPSTALTRLLNARMDERAREARQLTAAARDLVP